MCGGGLRAIPLERLGFLLKTDTYVLASIETVLYSFITNERVRISHEYRVTHTSIYRYEAELTHTHAHTLADQIVKLSTNMLIM